jgi:nitrate reductase (cytochrome)
MQDLTRREFLQTVTATAATVGLDWLTIPQQLEAQPAAARADRWVKGVCRFCGTGCGVLVGVKGGKVIGVQGDPENHNQGLLCIKGLLSYQMLNAPTRTRYPMVRKGNQFQRVRWEEALTLIVDRFRGAIRASGPDAVAFYGSGQSLTEESYVANKLFKGAIGTNNIDGNPRLCMASAAGGYVTTFGKDEPLGCYDDFDFADCFFVIGSNMAECHPVLWRRVLTRKEYEPGTRLIVADPRRTPTAAEADLHLQFIPGYDLALLNAIAYVLVEQGMTDPGFIAQHVAFHTNEGDTQSFEAYRQFLTEYAPEKVAKICGVPAGQIRQAAMLFGKAPAAVSLWTMGLNQRTRGVWVNNLVHNLHLITGKIGKPGSTPLSLTGQGNACGGVRDTGMLCHALPAGRLVTNPVDRAAMEKLWKLPPGRIAAQPGLAATEMFGALGTGKIQALLIMASNPGQSLPNLAAYRQAIAGKAFVVVADAFFPTRTAELADVVLPAALWVEKEGVYGCTDRRYQHLPKLLEPPGEAKSDLWILLELARRLGHGALFPFKSPEDVWNEWRRVARGTAYNFYGMTYARLRKERGLHWPCPDEKHPGTKRRYVRGDDPLVPTDTDSPIVFYGSHDRRAVVWLRPQEGPAEPPDRNYPFILTTGRVLEHWHTGTMTMTIPALRRAYPEAFVEMHPEDAAAVNVATGAKVKLISRRGTLELKVRISDAPRPGVLFVPFFDKNLLVNQLTIDAVDPISKQPEYKICAVKVERVR